MENTVKPDWYWSNGLHDAVIKDYFLVSLNYNYREKNPKRNYFALIIDSSNALWTTSIKMIKFYNVNNSPISIDARGWWWVNDQLEFDVTRNKWKLDICIANSRVCSRWISFYFDYAETINC